MRPVTGASLWGGTGDGRRAEEDGPMSAPPGWHLQPDGRERWWDGQQWTEQYRSPLPSDPTAPPSGPGWAGGDDQTQALDVDRTQQLPTQPPGGDQGTGGYVPPPAPGYGSPQQYSYPSGGGGTPATGYGSAGGAYPPPQQQGMSGAAKGCLIAAAVGLVILVIAVLGGIFLFRQAADEVGRQLETALPTTTSSPTAAPSETPTGTPSDTSTGLPSLGGEPVVAGIGEGFTLPRATIASGWTIVEGQLSSEVSGMSATFTDDSALPVAFTMSFEGSGDPVETFCTAAAPGDGQTSSEVVCVPLFGDVSGVDRVTVTPAL